MRVWVFPADEAGCGHYRLIWPAEAVRYAGVDVTVFKPGEQDAIPITVVESHRERRATLSSRARLDCDVMVVQRPTDWKWVQLIPQFQERGIRVVADIDDDLSALNVRHVAYHSTNPQTNRSQNHAHMAKALRVVDRVTVSTPALAERYGRDEDHAVVLSNCVPERYLRVRARRESGPPIIGWTGAIATHPGDLDVMGSAIGEVKRSIDLRWTIVGDVTGVKRVTGVEPELWPWVPIRDYPKTIARFDVGVVPLGLTPSNEAKSWLKGLEFAACRVPFVASPTSSYLALAERGAGLIAHRQRHWAPMLKSLLCDPILREEQIEAGFEAARLLTIEGNVDQWIRAWTLW